MKKIIAVIILLAALTSCAKRYELGSIDDFSVALEKSTYKVGEPILFTFNGKPDNVVFWSGEPGRKYEFRERTVVQGNSILLNFKSYAQYGPSPVDQSTLKLLVSTDFNGKYDSANVLAATWEDITSKAILSSGQDQTSSGNIDLNEFAARNKNMALAFRYKTAVVKPESAQNRWVIRSFDLKSVNEQKEETVLASMATAGWSSFNFSGPTTKWSVTSVQLLSVTNPLALDDDWVVTKQFNPNKTNPDKGETIKNISQNLYEYRRVYTKPGVYKVAFVATNVNVEESASLVKEMEITVTQ
ncbi:DUF5017 domain-containing protein [Niabella hibiscisoli]|uniref:DUF5017 domain-containing protein n=1 Tax=Niabella hibiscisoli TaxID=1825928 RepID=UPI001F0E9684|nr:DUF5017 domain-containing protein [Niabella hibiscisoli]MCH5719493.1 DUF5017 domain-containing protein [Niabella hibiscisoli]